jgi:hypothetical protein
MIVLVCGGRDYTNEALVFKTLDNLTDVTSIVSGLAKGADSLAEKWAITHGVPFVGYAADWKKEGKKAGYLRNRKMLEEGCPDLVVAFPGGRGTEMMVDIAKAANVPVHIVSDASVSSLEARIEVIH